MAHVLVFPSVLGVRRGITDTAERLRAAGHTAQVVDPYDGRTFEDYEPASAHVEQLGFASLIGTATDAAAGVADRFVAVGFSNGAAMAQTAAAAEPDRVTAVLLVGGALPMKYLETTWPAGVPAQVHACTDDPFDDGPEAAAEFRADVEGAGGTVAEFAYEGTGHLFNDPGLLEEYDADHAELFYERLLTFVDTHG